MILLEGDDRGVDYELKDNEPVARTILVHARGSSGKSKVPETQDVQSFGEGSNFYIRR